MGEGALPDAPTEPTPSCRASLRRIRAPRTALPGSHPVSAAHWAHQLTAKWCFDSISTCSEWSQEQCFLHRWLRGLIGLVEGGLRNTVKYTWCAVDVTLSLSSAYNRVSISITYDYYYYYYYYYYYWVSSETGCTLCESIRTGKERR